MGKSITLPETNREFPLILSILSFWEGFFPERTLVLGRVVFFVLVWLWGHFGASQGKATAAHFWMALTFTFMRETLYPIGSMYGIHSYIYRKDSKISQM